MKRPILLCLPVLALAACDDGPTPPSALEEQPSLSNHAPDPQLRSTDPDLKVAFIGDQGLNANAKAVLRLIRDEGADMVLHQGDFGYAESNPTTPTAWDDQIDGVLGPNFPYFGSVGNHDLEGNSWSETNGYQDRLEDRLTRIPGAVSCTGDYGVRSACMYRGLFFILSGTGTLGGQWDAQDAMYITDQLAANNATWSICSWHKNQRDMQVGGKGNEAGWPAYQACLAGGAIVATGHEHSYSRTHLMDSFQGLSTVSISKGTSGRTAISCGPSFPMSTSSAKASSEL